LAQISDAFHVIKDVSNSIEHATSEQSAASTEASRNIDQVSIASQTTVMHTSELMDDSDQLIKVAQGLSDLIIRFK
jgi:methyl-accepting chemotaxis protein